MLPSREILTHRIVWDTITVWKPMVWKKILRQPSIGIGNLPSKVVRLVYTIWHSFISERNDTMKL